jgi:glycosyltransferase involved in cell wall biosynthesis
MRADVEQRARSVGVEVLGARDDVPALLGDADLLVATSRPPEGLPGVLIEAGLSGVAAVTTDVPGARDVVEDGVTGLVVPVEEQARLVDSVGLLLEDPDRRKAMGRAARERCLELFTLDATTDEWDEVIRGMTP